jgi:hypothetical protein
MFIIENCILDLLSIHHIGNKHRDEPLITSEQPTEINNPVILEKIKHYFLKSFTSPEFYQFTFSNDDCQLNPLYQMIVHAFKHLDQFHDTSIDIAQYLFDLSDHPQIKSGDLFIAHLKHLNVQQENVSAIGIFKSEVLQPFIKINREQNTFEIKDFEGINIDKLDKGCLIFNTDQDKGFKICIVDKANKNNEAQYWREDFLNIKNCKDEFHQTTGFMSLTKQFVKEQLNEEFVVEKADQIDFLNKSAEYFKNKERFDKEEFAKEVFQNEQIIDSFHQFGEKHKNVFLLEDDFEISSAAVKQQSKIFKSILKLDKNFHVYIHGNRDNIVKGVDEDGRKYYKIYFQEES